MRGCLGLGLCVGVWVCVGWRYWPRVERFSSRDSGVGGGFAAVFEPETGGGARAKEVEAAMRVPIVTVVDKAALPPSGDARDYVSLSIYWWPNPITRLPYLPRDGLRNPEAESFDAPKLRLMTKTVQALAAANVESYDGRAVEWLRAWFVTSATRMNPHLTFAQMMPGVAAGGRQGIIEGLPIVTELLDAITWMDARGSIPAAERQEVRRWLSEYLTWLMESALGRAESARMNNHGTWYAVQICGLATFLGREDLARETLGRVARLSAQFEANGAQPEELRRRKAFAYSQYNLEAWAHLERMGQRHGLRLWSLGADRGLKYLWEELPRWGHADLEKPNGDSLKALERKLARWGIE